MLSAGFRVATSLPPGEVLARLTKLFENAGVTAERDATRVWSLRTPMPLTNVDRRLYSRRNRIGINPFALITGVSASASATTQGSAVDVVIDRRRLVLLALLEALLAISIASQAPLAPSIAIFVVLFGICALLFRWSLSLLRYEVGQELGSAGANR
jgi:hypothetical protein